MVFEELNLVFFPRFLSVCFILFENLFMCIVDVVLLLIWNNANDFPMHRFFGPYTAAKKKNRKNSDWLQRDHVHFTQQTNQNAHKKKKIFIARYFIQRSTELLQFQYKFIKNLWKKRQNKTHQTHNTHKKMCLMWYYFIFRMTISIHSFRRKLHMEIFACVQLVNGLQKVFPLVLIAVQIKWNSI